MPDSPQFKRVIGRVYDYFRPCTIEDKYYEAESGIRLIENDGYIWSRIKFDSQGNPTVSLGNPAIPTDLKLPKQGNK